MILEATLAISTLAASYAAYRFRQDAKGYYDAIDGLDEANYHISQLQTLNEDLQGKLIAAEAECDWNAEVIAGYRSTCDKCGKFASKKAERTAQLAAYVAGQA